MKHDTEMSRSKLYLLPLFILLNPCAVDRARHNAVILERDSPAVGDSGVLVEDIGLETFGGVFTPLLKTGCATPCKASEILSTVQDNQSNFQISLFRGKDKLVSSNHSLGVCYVVNIPPAPRGFPQIEVTVEAANKEIRMSALDNATKKPMPIQCDAKSPS